MARFEIGNKEAEKWTEEDARLIIELMRTNAIDSDKILCLQDATHSVNLYSSGLNYLLDKFPVFEAIKKDIQSIVTARVNAKALTGEFNATASIWRMKQCGEKDEAHIDHTTKNEKIGFNFESATTDELIKRAEALKLQNGKTPS